MRKRFTFVLTAVLTASTLFSPIAMAEEEPKAKVLSIADDYLGVPYKYGGTTPSAFDCSGYTGYVFNKAGIDLPRTAAQQYNVGSPVSKSELQEGDLVFFQTTSTKISHVGIYIGDNQFVSATTSKGVKVDSLSDPYYWGSRYVGAKRIISEEEEVAPVVEEVKLAPGEYLDVKSTNWAYEAIKDLSTQDIITGYKDQNFLPDKAITRAEAAKMLTSSFAMTASSTTTESYKDVPEAHWASTFIAAATENELLNGYKNEIFKPDEAITRAEVATLLARAFEIEQNGPATSFNDLADKHWAYESVQALATNQIINGYKNQTFRPDEAATRAEFTYMLHQAMNQ